VNEGVSGKTLLLLPSGMTYYWYHVTHIFIFASQQESFVEIVFLVMGFETASFQYQRGLNEEPGAEVKIHVTIGNPLEWNGVSGVEWNTMTVELWYSKSVWF
jgi:hypothetical protein